MKHKKIYPLVLLLILLLSITPVHISAVDPAASGQCGENVSWSLHDGVLTLSGSGRMRDYGASGADSFLNPWRTLDVPVETVIIGEGITYIGKYGFSHLESLRSVTISSTITEIGDGAFYACKNLTDITIPGTVSSFGSSIFYNCSSLTNLTLSEGLNSLSYSMFEGCSSLSDITLPSTMEHISERAFYGCNPSSIIFPENISFIGNSAFAECRKLLNICFTGNAFGFMRDPFFGVIATAYYPVNNTSWAGNALQDYGGTLSWVGVTDPGNVDFSNPVNPQGTCGEGLTWSLNSGVLTISGSGKMISAPWYGYCTEISSVIINEGVTEIVDRAFVDCSNLKSVSIPGTVARIGNTAFSCCYSLAEITIPENVTEIGSSAFESCTALKSVVIPSGVKMIGSRAFAECKNLTKVAIPNTVVSIGGNAFEACSSLTSIDLPGSLTIIESRTFFLCSALSSVKLNSGVKYIRDSAFNGTAIQEITIPATVEKIEGYVFTNCKSLKSIVFEGNAPVIDFWTFYNVTANAYFPRGNTTWDSNAKKGTNITWIEGFGGNAGSCGTSVTYKLDNGVLTISGSGKMDEFTADQLPPWYGIASEIKKVIISQGITNISNFAFSNCKNMQQIIIPNSVTEIGTFAFSACENLGSITLPDGIQTLNWMVLGGCKALKEVVIPASVTYVDGLVFGDCTSLAKITFQGDAPTFDKVAFGNLKSCVVYYPADNATWTSAVQNTYEGLITWQMNTSSVVGGGTGEDPVNPDHTMPDHEVTDPVVTDPAAPDSDVTGPSNDPTLPIVPDDPDKDPTDPSDPAGTGPATGTELTDPALNSDDTTDDNGAFWGIVIGISVALVIGGAAGFIIWKKKV